MKIRHDKKARSLALSVLLWMLVVALVPLIIMAVQGLHCANQAIVALESSHLQAVLQARRARIDDWFMERTEDILAVARVPSAWRDCTASLGNMTDAQRASYNALLTYLRSKSHSYESIAAFDKTWEPVAVSAGALHVGSNDLAPPEFRRKLEGATGVVIMPPHFHEGGVIGIHLGTPVLNTNQTAVGYVVASMNLSDTVYPILADSAGLRPDTKVYLLTDEGRTVGNASHEGQRMSEDQRLPEEITTGDGKRVLRYRDYHGARVFGVSVAMPRLGWVLVAESSEREAFLWVRTLRWRAFWTGLASLCVVFALAFRSSRRLLVPLRRLSQTARRIADGHWQERVGHLKGAEPEEVGQAFNSMLDELAGLQKRLVQSAALSAVGELSARVVHEMRNPLSSVKMNLKALREKVKDDPTYSELAEIASGQTERLEHMLTDLLHYGKPLELKKTPVSFRELAGQVTEALGLEAEANGVELTIRDQTEGRMFAADREQVERAITNLVDNAIRVTPRNSTVVISGEVAGEAADARLLISVCDTGDGIPQDVAEKLFKPFFTTRGDGTGLGLANVRKIAELHGGTACAENLPEKGAKFTVSLPLGALV